MNSRHDNGYKRLFSHPEMVRDLLTGFVAEPWVEEVDFDSLEKYSGEFVDDRLRNRRNDVIWRLPWGRDWLYIYLLLEFQSGVHPFMAARLSTYVDLLYQDLIRARHFVRPVAKGRRSVRRLPPVLPIVLYNGQRPWTAPTDLKDLIAPGPSALVPYQPGLRYVLIDENTYADSDLATMRNLVAALFRLEQSRDPEPVHEAVRALGEWLTDPEQSELRHSFVVWLREAFLATRLPGVELPELNELENIRTMLSERVVSWTEQWKQDGLRQGRQEGLSEGLSSERRLLLRQIRRRFGEAAAERSAPLLAGIDDPMRLEDLGEVLLDCVDAKAWEARLAS